MKCYLLIKGRKWHTLQHCMSAAGRVLTNMYQWVIKEEDTVPIADDS